MLINDSRILFAPERRHTPDVAPIVVLDRLRTPENIGNIIRLAANVGVRRIVSIEEVRLGEGRIRKTACMAWDYVELVRTDYDAFDRYIPADYQWVALETTPSSQSVFAARLPQRMALVAGSEVLGVRPELLDRCALHVHIPMTGPATSMNVSHATSVALFEWVRRYAVQP